MLRHFAEKQQESESDSRILRESLQPVPEIFRDVLTETLERVAYITGPSRATLKQQCETGRLLPSFSETDLVSFTDLYTYLTGNPFWLDFDRDAFIKEYRQGFDPEVLHQLH
eukprot:gene17079-16900_t